jgi:23S rRNA (uracil1939-C5)-methyltransferase
MTVERLADDGRGVARVNGKTVFIRGALAGEVIKSRYHACHKNYDEAELVNVVEASPARITPQCEYFNHCGGCSLQHLDYEQQLQHKQAALERLLTGVVKPESWQSPLLGDPWGYRHRARFAVSADRQGVRLGFRRADSHEIVDIAHCDIIFSSLSERLIEIKAMLSSLVNRTSISDLSIVEDSAGLQGVMLLSKHPLIAADLDLLTAFAQRSAMIVEVQQGKAFASKLVWRSTDKVFSYKIPMVNVDLPFGFTDFTQVNPAINRLLVERAISWLALDSSDTLADFFCGLGNFSFAVAQHIASVVGFEMMRAMVARANGNVTADQFSNIVFKQADLMSQAFVFNNTFNKVLLDPPRAGAEQLCRQLAVNSVEKIVYVSCNPATFARDSEILLAGGYSLQKISMAEMFPQTLHVELIGLFVYGDKNKRCR